MDFWDVIRKQRMTRRFLREPPPFDVIERVVGAGRKAPSAGNTQSVSLILLENEAVDLFWKLTRPRHCRGLNQPPPIVLLPLVSKHDYLARYAEPDKVETGRDRESNWPEPVWTIDCAFVAMTILLAATAEGLGCWFFGIFAGEQELRDALGIPRGQQMIGAIGIGYPAPQQRKSPSLSRARKPFEHYLRRKHW